MTTITDHKWKPLLSRWDVPAAVLADQFDYQDAESVSDGFFCYRRTWYHLGQFMRTEGWGTHTAEYLGWDGFAADSFFSGVAIALSPDGEEYKVATILSGGDS